jgi:hypothetical protein
MAKQRNDPVEERAQTREKLAEERGEDRSEERQTPPLHGGWTDDAGAPGLKDAAKD